eukprot:scaffold6852_cov215-Ochromonas_danica.AAC.12
MRLISRFPYGLLGEAARFIPKIPKIVLNENPEIRKAGTTSTGRNRPALRAECVAFALPHKYK